MVPMDVEGATQAASGDRTDALLGSTAVDSSGDQSRQKNKACSGRHAAEELIAGQGDGTVKMYERNLHEHEAAEAVDPDIPRQHRQSGPRIAVPAHRPFTGPSDGLVIQS